MQLNSLARAGVRFLVCSALGVSLPAFASQRVIVLKTIADANAGTKHNVDLGEHGPSQGDIFVFDQPLLNAQHKAIGNNSGFCITVRPGVFSQCQWTLQLDNGTITIGGQEAATGPSTLPVIGATGAYQQYHGVLVTQPLPDGTFSQIVTLRRTAQ
jgi:allene oxide cyclase-like protein